VIDFLGVLGSSGILVPNMTIKIVKEDGTGKMVGKYRTYSISNLCHARTFDNP
jgi:hypothetical protein